LLDDGIKELRFCRRHGCHTIGVTVLFHFGLISWVNTICVVTVCVVTICVVLFHYGLFTRVVAICVVTICVVTICVVTICVVASINAVTISIPSIASQPNPFSTGSLTLLISSTN